MVAVKINRSVFDGDIPKGDETGAILCLVDDYPFLLEFSIVDAFDSLHHNLLQVFALDLFLLELGDELVSDLVVT